LLIDYGLNAFAWSKHAVIDHVSSTAVFLREAGAHVIQAKNELTVLQTNAWFQGKSMKFSRYSIFSFRYARDPRPNGLMAKLPENKCGGGWRREISLLMVRINLLQT